MSNHNQTIGFRQHGTGPEYVLVMHDWNSDRTVYDAIIHYLDESTFTYVFVDLRGYGESKNMVGNYDLEEIASDCFKVADQLGWQRFHLIGHSMTGMVTQRMAADAPLRIKSAIAVCPISAAGTQFDQNTYAFFTNTIENDDLFCRLMQFVTGGRLSENWAKTKLRHNRENVSPKCRLGYLAMFAKTHFVEEVKGLKTPYLILISEHDPGLDEEAMRQTFLAWHPNAELLEIPNCGHYPMQECPPYFASVIEDFLHRCLDC
jgi:3-oxoadipate enol-lactonase